MKEGRLWGGGYGEITYMIVVTGQVDCPVRTILGRMLPDSMQFRRVQSVLHVR